MVPLRLQKPRITKQREGWKRQNGRLQSRRCRPPPFKKLAPKKLKDRILNVHSISDDSPIIEAVPNSTSTASTASPSELLSAFGGPNLAPFDPDEFGHLHPRKPPPRYRHQIVEYFLGANPMVRPRRVGWGIDRPPRNPKFLELASSLPLLSKTITYINNLIREERARIEVAMEELRGLDKEGGWKVKWGVGCGSEEIAKKGAFGKGHVYDYDLEIEGEFWEEKRVVVLRCAVLEECICLAEEIEGAVRDARGRNGGEWDGEWYTRFWVERTFV